MLHTWGRQLQFHPHVHCVVPAGGLRADGLRWCQPKSADFFLPHKVLAARFRTRLKAAFHGQPDTTQIGSQVWRQNWVIDVQQVGSGEAALKYLSAYVYRTAIGAQRIIADQDGQITFQYQDSGERQWHRLTLRAMEFIRRFLQHVLPKGFPRVRYYGWLSAAATAKWKRILSLLDWKPPALTAVPPPPPVSCPSCGAPLFRIGLFTRGPP